MPQSCLILTNVALSGIRAAITCKIEILQKLQNRDARVISGKTYETRSRKILSDLGW